MNMREFTFVLAVIALILSMVLGTFLYSSHQNRSAYYKCLEVTEKVVHRVETTKAIVSLPFCSI